MGGSHVSSSEECTTLDTHFLFGPTIELPRRTLHLLRVLHVDHHVQRLGGVRVCGGRADLHRTLPGLDLASKSTCHDPPTAKGLMEWHMSQWKRAHKKKKNAENPDPRSPSSISGCSICPYSEVRGLQPTWHQNSQAVCVHCEVGAKCSQPCPDCPSLLRSCQLDKTRAVLSLLSTNVWLGLGNGELWRGLLSLCHFMCHFAAVADFWHFFFAKKKLLTAFGCFRLLFFGLLLATFPGYSERLVGGAKINANVGKQP